MGTKWQAGVARFFIRTVGSLSDGVRMSFQHGFISGKMLDYIYANKPSGRWGIGILVDKIYLSHPGWKAIRQRKASLEAYLEEAITKVDGQKAPVKIIDVASGPAQYMVDVAGRVQGKALSILCRDYDAQWVEEGRIKARRAGLSCISFSQGDAFDRESFLPLMGQYDIAVVSGFYDWITDDELVKKSMGIIRDVLKPGGYFVFTNQSGHFDLKFVEDVFVDFNKNPLKMKTRSNEQVRQWLAGLGFDVLKCVSDGKGFYSVFLAQRST